MEYPDTTSRPDAVTFDGSTFYAVDRPHGTYWIDRDARSLHRVIYEHAHGPAVGLDVHHDDHDTLNNDPANLVAITHEEHRRRHVVDRIETDPAYATQLGAWFDAGREAARIWHGSEAGRAWHAEHAAAQWTDEARARRSYQATCEQCGGSFTAYQERARYCSGACVQRASRERYRGADEQRCEQCGEPFTAASKFRPQRFCSRPCSARAVAASRKQRH